MQNNISVYYIDISLLEPSCIDLLLDALPANERRKLLTFRLLADRLRGAIGKHLVQKILCNKGYGPDVLLSVKRDGYCRPFIDNRVDFNISHSGDLVVIAVGHCLRLGIDVEEIKPVNVEDFSLTFSNEELWAIKQFADPLILFYDLWTKKEAVLKANGKGMHLPVEEVTIMGDKAFCEQEEWQLCSLRLLPGYACSVAFSGKQDIVCQQVQLKFEREGFEWEYMVENSATV